MWIKAETVDIPDAEIQEKQEEPIQKEPLTQEPTSQVIIEKAIITETPKEVIIPKTEDADNKISSITNKNVESKKSAGGTKSLSLLALLSSLMVFRLS